MIFTARTLYFISVFLLPLFIASELLSFFSIYRVSLCAFLLLIVFTTIAVFYASLSPVCSLFFFALVHLYFARIFIVIVIFKFCIFFVYAIFDNFILFKKTTLHFLYSLCSTLKIKCTRERSFPLFYFLYFFVFFFLEFPSMYFICSSA